ncbi:hypothetical protein F183_A03820 [Bryobacterales bacterium F-183]|nr:hypothetical protein F183_A03820 [Bryobacterales bacterium F-183]
MAHAVTLYVSTSGNDSGTCRSNQPCRTITRATALAVAGDVIEIAPGTYPERVIVNRSGSSASNPITYRGHNGSGCPSTPLADIQSRGFRPAPTVTTWGFYIRGDYLVFDCLRAISPPAELTVVSGDNRSGFYINNGRRDITVTNSVVDANNRPGTMAAGIATGTLANALPFNIRASRNYVTRTAYGFLIYCAANCLFENNEVEDLKSNGGDMDYSRIFGRNITMRGNYFHGNSTLNCVGCHVDCFQTWNLNQNSNEIAQNIVLDGNTCFNAHQGIILRDTTSSQQGMYASHFNWTVTNNVFAYGPTGSSMAWCALFAHVGNVVFRHNLCLGSGQVGYLNGTTGTHEYNLHINQTTPYNAKAIGTSWAAGSITARNNLIFNPSRVFTSTTFPNDLLNVDPNLASSAASDFRLTLSSPAMNRALGSPVVSDKNGTSRPQGGLPDIGPFELTTSRFFTFGIQSGRFQNEDASSYLEEPPNLLEWNLNAEGTPVDGPEAMHQTTAKACTLSAATITAEEDASFRLVVEMLLDEPGEDGLPQWKAISGVFGLANMQSYGNTALSDWETTIPANAVLRVRMIPTPEGIEQLLSPAKVVLRCDEKPATPNPGPSDDGNN